ncbi:MAG TPA: hypothetical protein VKD72_25720 [Gemmataceae bacterium]|nr:hypothetical protein [Gemmataceae bacterium]
MLALSQVLSDPAAWGAFLTGMGSVLGAMFSLKRTRKRAEDECAQRLADIKEAFRRGTQFERRAEARGRKQA